MPTPTPKNPERVAVPDSAVQAGAERVFVTHPRVFSFSSRSLASLRHPYLPLALAQAEADLAKVKRQFQTKAERLADILTPTAQSFKFEEERWTHVGFMLDTILFEDQISVRRDALMNATNVVRETESLWSRAVEPGGQISREQYVKLHLHLYDRLLCVSDPSLSALIATAIDEDWRLDNIDGADSIAFSTFFISVLEVADNWIPVRDPEAYATFIAHAFDGLFDCEPAKSDATVDEDDWGQVVESIRSFSMNLTGVPVIRLRRLASGGVVYERSAVA